MASMRATGVQTNSRMTRNREAENTVHTIRAISRIGRCGMVTVRMNSILKRVGSVLDMCERRMAINIIVGRPGTNTVAAAIY